MNSLVLDTSGVRQRVADERRAGLAQTWDLEAARALLRCSTETDDVRLCCESLLVTAIATEFSSFRQADRFVAKQLGALAHVCGAESLDQVLCQRVAWLRLLELCWLCDNVHLAELLLQGPLAAHPLADAILDESDDFSGPLAHVRVAWRWQAPKRGRVVFETVPPLAPDGPMNGALRKTFYPANTNT